MPIVFRAGIQAYVQPGHAVPRGAQPERTGAHAKIHGVADGPPEGVLLRRRSRARELREMAEVTVTCRTWRHEHGIAPEIPERHDVPILPEMSGEDSGLRLHACQRRTRYEHALEGARATLLVHCRAFPAVSLERHAAKTGDPERAKRTVRSPGRADLMKGHRAARYRDFTPSLRARAKLRRLDVPHLHRPRNAESSFGPSGVRMLSGWNCTPSSASALCRTPMTSPSAVQAVTSNASGTVSRLAMSEW